MVLNFRPDPMVMILKWQQTEAAQSQWIYRQAQEVWKRLSRVLFPDSQRTGQSGYPPTVKIRTPLSESSSMILIWIEMALFHSLLQDVRSQSLRRRALSSPFASDLYLH